MTRSLLVAAAICLLAPPSARAADDPAAAKEHYVKGSKLYDILKYREAAREFEAAYQAKADPAFLYNMGQAYRLAGDSEHAIGAYRSYLRRVPEARNRKEVEEHIAQLQRVLDQERVVRERAPADTQAPTPTPEVAAAPTTAPTPTPTATPAAGPTEGGGGFTKKVAGGVVAGVGLVAVGVGAAFAAMAQSASGQITNATPGSTFDPSLEDTFKSDRTIAIGLLAGGGAALAAGAAVLVLGFREGPKPPAVTVAPLVGRDGAGATLRLSF